MNLTPAEIREKRFKTKVMGYGANEVDAFTSMVADEFEELLKEADTLREEVRRLNADLELYNRVVRVRVYPGKNGSGKHDPQIYI